MIGTWHNVSKREPCPRFSAADVIYYPRSVKEVEDRGEDVIATRVSQSLSPHFGGLRTRAHLLPSILRGLSCQKIEVEDHAVYRKDGAERRADGENERKHHDGR